MDDGLWVLFVLFLYAIALGLFLLELFLPTGGILGASATVNLLRAALRRSFGPGCFAGSGSLETAAGAADLSAFGAAASAVTSGSGAAPASGFSTSAFSSVFSSSAIASSVRP